MHETTICRSYMRIKEIPFIFLLFLLKEIYKITSIINSWKIITVTLKTHRTANFSMKTEIKKNKKEKSKIRSTVENIFIIRGKGYKWRSSGSALGYFISKITSHQLKILDKKSSFIIFVGLHQRILKTTFLPKVWWKIRNLTDIKKLNQK